MTTEALARFAREPGPGNFALTGAIGHTATPAGTTWAGLGSAGTRRLGHGTARRQGGGRHRRRDAASGVRRHCSSASERHGVVVNDVGAGLHGEAAGDVHPAEDVVALIKEDGGEAPGQR